ncbi:MAG: POTRA domain-containing protein, partial [Acidobacteriota bacterium]
MPASLAALALVVGLQAMSSPAPAEVRALLGRRVTDVRVDAAGDPVTDTATLTLVETRIGETLTMAAVRETIDHFVTLGRYADIQVFASADGEGVRLRYAVVPIARIAHLRFAGALGLDPNVLRTELADDFGALPASSRVADMARSLVTRYQAHGYPAARVESRIVPDGRLGQVVATFTVSAGRQVVVRQATVTGNGGTDLVQKLGLQTGRPLDRTAFDDRVRAVEDGLRDDAYYEAVVSATVTDVAPGQVDVAVRAERGDRVHILFAGDPLPDDRRRSLVPIARLRSVDEEVVEDGSRNLEQYLRLEGYRTATAPAERRRANGQLQITFTVARGPLHVLGAVTVTGTAGLSRAELDPLMKLQAGEPFVDARVAAVAAAMAEYYRVRGFAAARVAPRLTLQSPDAAGRVPVAVRFEVVEGPRTVVTEVRFEGATAVTPAQLLESMALTVGKPYYRPQQAIDREAIERRYRNLGYQRAAVEALTAATADSTGAALTYVVREGPQTRVDHVLVSGTSRTSPELVRREITLAPGSPLGYDAVLESQQKLSALGLFRRVRITEAPHGVDDTLRDVLVEVEEAPSTSVSFGGGLEVGRQTRTGADGGATDALTVAPRGFFEVTRRNLWGKNRSLSLLTSVSLRPTDPGADAAPGEKGGYGLNQYRVIGTFREPRAFGTVGDAQFSAFVERGIRSSFNFDRRGVRAEYARRFVNRIVAVGRYSYDYTTLFDTKIAVADQLLIDRLFPQVRLSSLFGSALRDSRNDVLDPERGGVLGTDLELALRSIGSEVGFAKGFAQAF